MNLAVMTSFHNNVSQTVFNVLDSSLENASGCQEALNESTGPLAHAHSVIHRVGDAVSPSSHATFVEIKHSSNFREGYQEAAGNSENCTVESTFSDIEQSALHINSYKNESGSYPNMLLIEGCPLVHRARSEMCNLDKATVSSEFSQSHSVTGNSVDSFHNTSNTITEFRDCRSNQIADTPSSVTQEGGCTSLWNNDVIMDDTFRSPAECTPSGKKISFSSSVPDDICRTFSTKNTPEHESILRRKRSWRKVMNAVQYTTSLVQLYKKRKYPWIQLAGHQGNFVTENNGTIMKLFCPREHECFLKLKDDLLAPYIPHFYGLVERDGNQYVLLEDLLCGVRGPNIMDIKIGVRTYLEEELVKARKHHEMRNDMYVKMVEVDMSAPTAEEHAAQGITKPRYMEWRETVSSSATLGFRIEGICLSDGTASKSFKMTRTREEVSAVLRRFMRNQRKVLIQFIERLATLRDTLERSTFFSTHEVVGSSLLFVFDDTGKSNMWMIDFGKSTPLPENFSIDHRSEWREGNREDGYLYGVDHLIDILTDILHT